MRSRADFLEALRNFVTSNGKRPELDTNFNPPFDPIFNSDNVEGNNPSNTKIPLQILPATEKSDHATGSAEHSVAWSVDPRTGYGGHFLHHGRHLPRHGGHLQHGKSGERFCIFLNFSIRISLTGKERFLFASDGRCGQHSAPRALCTRKHVLACGSRT